MGVKQLWEELKVYCDRTQVSVVHESVKEAILNTANVRGLRVGIDISVWIFQACYHTRHTRNAALASIFIKIMRIFSMTAIIPFFVFDGPSRPRFKRGKHLRRSTHWLESDVKKLLTAAGFAWTQAPGEAEAELAWLCRDNWIDTILTEDVDAIVFGAPCVLRLVNIDHSDITAYRYDNCQLSREQLVLVAVFRGGDYAAGIPCCGIKTAIKISYFGTSQRLIQAGLSLNVQELRVFLQQWRIDFQAELHAHLSKRVRQLTVPRTFPSARVLRLYLFPVTSAPATPYILSWDLAPDLRQIAKLASTNLDSCNTFKKLLQRFDKMILPGLAIRELLKRLMERDNSLDADISPYPVLSSLAAPRKGQHHREETHVYVNLSIPSTVILDIILGGADGRIEEDYRPFTHTGARSVKAWVPRGLYEYVLSQPDPDESHETELDLFEDSEHEEILLERSTQSGYDSDLVEITELEFRGMKQGGSIIELSDSE